MRHFNMLCVIGLLVVGLTRGVAGQVGDYRTLESVHLPDSSVEAYHGERFLIVIQRRFDSDRERELIERAESLLPSAELIERAEAEYLADHSGSGSIRGFRDAARIPGDRWWWRPWDDTLLPFALTGAAVQHYVQRVRELSAGPNPFAEHEPGVEHTASVEYVAEASQRPDSGGTEVRLEVKWSFFCGGTCGLWFTHSRRVVFDENGEVVLVEGDGSPDFMVS